MAEVSRTTLLGTIAANLPDNTTAEISPADIRGELNNLADSVAFKITGQTAAPTANDDSAGTAGNGTFAVGDFWIDETNNIAYIANDVTATAAVWSTVSALTGLEIKTLYEAEADTNAFDDAAVSKLAGIEALATADMTGAEIKAAYEAEADTNAFDDAAVSKLAGITAGANVNVTTDLGYTTAATTGTVTSSDGTDATIPAATTTLAGLLTGADKTKLDGIEALATADQTGAEIKAAYEAEADTNAFDDAAVSKLAGIEAGAERSTPAIIADSASRTLALTDERDIIEIDTSGGAVVLTIPANASVAFPIGTVISITLLDATNAATITADTGVTLNGVSTGSGVITATAYSGVSLYKRATDAWVVQGQVGTVA